MSNMKNKVQLIGNLGNAPELKTTPNGHKVLTMSMATNEVFRNQKGERVTETTWHRVVAWGGLAENMGRLLQKGSEVVVEGKICNRQYQDKTGVTKYITEIKADNMLVLDKRAAA